MRNVHVMREEFIHNKKSLACFILYERIKIMEQILSKGRFKVTKRLINVYILISVKLNVI